MSPSFMSFLPEHRLGSQWPRSQQAALKEGREEEESPMVASESRLVLRGGPRWMCFPREEKLSFLWRTMAAVVVLGRMRSGETGVCWFREESWGPKESNVCDGIHGLVGRKSYGFVTLSLSRGLSRGKSSSYSWMRRVCTVEALAQQLRIQLSRHPAGSSRLQPRRLDLSYHLTVAVWSVCDLRAGAYLCLLVWKGA